MRKMFWHSGIGRDDYDHESYVSWHPVSASRQLPKWVRLLADIQQALIKEVYVALHGDARSLAMMGVRAIIDLEFVEMNGDRGSFEKQLKDL